MTCIPEAMVEMNPADAARLGLKFGDPVRVTSRRGTIVLRARVTSKAVSGVVFIPFHFAEAAANLLTIDVVDPQAKIPEYKACAVRIVPVSEDDLPDPSDPLILFFRISRARPLLEKQFDASLGCSHRISHPNSPFAPWGAAAYAPDPWHYTGFAVLTQGKWHPQGCWTAQLENLVKRAVCDCDCLALFFHSCNKIALLYD
jgi:formylmethanofuran dehydrogenase subunit D